MTISINDLRRTIRLNRSLTPEDVEFHNKSTKSLLSFIGDIHKNKESYRNLSNQAKYTLQLGDLANSSDVISFLEDKDPTYHKYIYGNHDWLKTDFQQPLHNLGDYGIWAPIDFQFEIGYISGAYSIDINMRKGNSYDPWHENEEMSYSRLQDAIDYIVDKKPQVIVSHTAPLCVHCNLRLYEGYGLVKSRTMLALESIFAEWKPTLWVFGHYHQNVSFNMDRTLFVCVDANHQMPIRY